MIGYFFFFSRLQGKSKNKRNLNVCCLMRECLQRAKSLFTKIYLRSLESSLAQFKVEIREKKNSIHIKERKSNNLAITNKEGMEPLVSLPTIYMLKKGIGTELLRLFQSCATFGITRRKWCITGFVKSAET